MNAVTAVTGPMRSGTSCLTGLLEQCGVDLGRQVRILRNPTEMNPKGHFEPDLLFTINERLLVEVPHGPWSIFHVPEEQALAELAAKRERYFQLFIRKFDGELFKDPLMCLTLPFWERHWPDLQHVIFCLRHPLAVARSMETRYGLPITQGLELWHTYTSRFFLATTRCRIFVFDFDAFIEAPAAVFVPLLEWLELPLREEEPDRRLDGFFTKEYVHWACDDAALRSAPAHVSDLYLEIRSHTGQDPAY